MRLSRRDVRLRNERLDAAKAVHVLLDERNRDWQQNEGRLNDVEYGEYEVRNCLGQASRGINSVNNLQSVKINFFPRQSSFVRPYQSDGYRYRG